MNGLELSRAYYEQFGKPMLEENFPELLDKIAVGFVGSGSERFGFDDEISRDHDFEPGFCIFLPDESVVSEKDEFRLERAYAKLPKEFEGVKRQIVSAVGGSRNGVMRTAEFYKNAVGEPDGALSLAEWLRIPDHALAEATNGEVFYDGYGEFSAIRDRLHAMPGDVWYKRLAGNLMVMAQAGQYNFLRCLKHGEYEAAQLACTEFVNAAMRTAFLLSGEYMPYYKWSFRALRCVDAELADKLSFILCADSRDDETAEHKYDTIEEAASYFIAQLQELEITKAICGDLEKHAYSVNDNIEDVTIRNMNIFDGV